MANYAAKVTESWQVATYSTTLYSYGGEWFVIGFYDQDSTQVGIGMFKSIDAGEAKMSNGGVTWHEVDIPNAPRNSWSMAYGADPTLLTRIHSDRYGDIVYFTCQSQNSSGPSWTSVQVGSFDLSTGLWGAQGTDNATNPAYPENTVSGLPSVRVSDIKAVGTNDLIITYTYHDTPSGVTSDFCTIYGVRYTAGVWGTPFVVLAGTEVAYTLPSTHARLMHEQTTDYVHFLWGQTTGPNGNPAPAETDLSMMSSTYTLSTDVLGAASAFLTRTGVPHATGTSGGGDLIMSFGIDHSGVGWMQMFWAPTSTDQSWYITGTLNSSTPTWTTGVISTVNYEYNVNNRMAVNQSGDLISLHTIGSDNASGGSPVNTNPQVAYQLWNGTSFDADLPVIVIATGYDVFSRTTNDIPLPDAANPEDYGGDFGVHVIGHAGTPESFNLAWAPSSFGATGIVCMFYTYWERLFDAEASACYFVREPTPTPSGTSVGVRY